MTGKEFFFFRFSGGEYNCFYCYLFSQGKKKTRIFFLPIPFTSMTRVPPSFWSELVDFDFTCASRVNSTELNSVGTFFILFFKSIHKQHHYGKTKTTHYLPEKVREDSRSLCSSKSIFFVVLKKKTIAQQQQKQMKVTKARNHWGRGLINRRGTHLGGFFFFGKTQLQRCACPSIWCSTRFSPTAQ